MIDNITDANFLIFAMKAYNSPNTVLSEFEEDLKRIKYIKRLVKKYQTTGELKERLILNHIIVMGNVFGIAATVKMLFFKFDHDDYHILKTFLTYLNYMPPYVAGIRGVLINSKDIPMDHVVAQRLKTI